ncbi:MAG: insulinase family protein [Lewinellaceae bacterium]|nr:insulinase family protein [Saprospiraceae bacterium]MCB9338140.1 insulinase family protein [Lewinellaceae bacterium]
MIADKTTAFQQPRKKLAEIASPKLPLGQRFTTLPTDPLKVKMCTLGNGMKLYLSTNDTEPRIFTNIAVRAGSKHDPEEATGLAHYLEHMMFKGTRGIGALDWEREQALLQKIANLYEQHRFETDPEKRREYYHQIDLLSGEAATLAAANEYDKLASAIGAKATNAYTWVEQTVYVNDIPSNELERWMQMESERFREVVLRLFHTELETVYEEFNMNQDRDFRKVSAAVNEVLFPTHPYGKWTTMGKGEHLKNPSHVKIYEYFSRYYRPNNMALVMAGDFDPEEAVVLAEKYFGTLQPADIPPFEFDPPAALNQVVRREILGQEAPYLQMAWRFDGATSPDADYLTLIYRLLYNGRAGLIDLDLLQKQLVLDARAYTTNMEDYSIFQLYGKPREGQDLADVERLLLAALEKIKQGEFEDWLIEACIKDLKFRDLQASENNSNRAAQLTNTFIWGMDWGHFTGRFQRLEKCSKADIVRFARERFGDNYVVVYKKNGDDPNVLKVEKPPITPVAMNRTDASAFTQKFLSATVPSLDPVFVDFEKTIVTRTLDSGVELDYLKNKNNPTFILDYILEMGRNSDRELAFAIAYLPYLGTDKYTPEELKQAFFRLGLNFSVNVNEKKIYVTLGGLDESLEAGVALFEHILQHVTGNRLALDNLIADRLLNRENNKKNKQFILRNAMYSYARYGAFSPFTHKLSAEEMLALQPEFLVGKIKQLTSYEHKVFYYGSKSPDEVAAVLNRHHRVPQRRLPLLPPQNFVEQPTSENKVVFVDFPMVQADIMLVSKGTESFNLEEYKMAELHNTYFGSGMSSVFFQEIRESRALAYSAYATYGSPAEQDEAHYLRAYIGTQPDKMVEAISAMQEIVENMPFSETQILQAALSIQKKIETSRVTKDSVYWAYRQSQRRGYGHDLRRDVYEKMKTVEPAELLQFHNENVKGRNYTFLVLGSKASVDFDYLSTIGTVSELKVDEVFGE